jgi:hypothetical protein
MVNGKPGNIVTCKHCNQTSAYSKEECRLAHSSWT